MQVFWHVVLQVKGEEHEADESQSAAEPLDVNGVEPVNADVPEFVSVAPRPAWRCGAGRQFS